jgi:GntR family transcriptional regulator/MocR family aminotransferase
MLGAPESVIWMSPLALVTPANHYPSGAVLSLPRRLELLNWAGTHDSWVLEDDYDSAFRYAGRPVPALKSLDQARRVLFAGSFSKTLFPGLRLGYLIVPPELVDAFRRASRLQSQGQPAQPQAALAAFMVSGQFGAHVRRMRRLYAERRGALMDALRVAFGGRCVLEAPAGGLHILVRFPDLADDTMLARRAAGAGLGALALSSLAIAHHQGQGLLLAFTNIPSNEAEAAVTRLKTAIDAA